MLNKPIVAYGRNKHLRDVTGGTTVENSEVVRKQKAILKNCYCKPCFSGTSNLCCKQVVPATTFKSDNILKTYQIFHQLNCKRKYIYIYIYIIWRSNIFQNSLTSQKERVKFFIGDYENIKALFYTIKEHFRFVSC